MLFSKKIYLAIYGWSNIAKLNETTLYAVNKRKIFLQGIAYIFKERIISIQRIISILHEINIFIQRIIAIFNEELF